MSASAPGLPIDAILPELRRVLAEHVRAVLEAPPGTGKTTRVPLALLDAEGNGWVLSSLHARSGTRVYAKAIRSGRSDAALSEEETAAIRQASA